jgi:hypothetical protein
VGVINKNNISRSSVVVGFKWAEKVMLFIKKILCVKVEKSTALAQRAKIKDVLHYLRPLFFTTDAG